MTKSRWILISSLALNIALVGLAGVFIYRRGIISSLLKKEIVARPQETVKIIDSSIYRTRQTIFDQLPQHEGAIIFVGDSITNNGEWAELFQRGDILNRGIDSDFIEGIQRRRGELLRHHPRKLFLMIGINDFLVDNKSSDEVVANYRLTIQTLRAEAPQTQLIIQSILPINKIVYSSHPSPLADEEHKALDDKIIRVNKELSRMADGKQILYVDLYSEMVDARHQLDGRYTYDGLHPNGEGYNKWRDIIRPLVQ